MLKCSSSNSTMGFIILVISVIFAILVMVDPVQSCHRKVEYHHYYKKQPVKGWGWGWPSHGHNSHKGYSQGNGGYGKGWGHGYGGGHQQKGHEKGYGGGHEKGYGGGHEKGYGGGHEKGYGGGHQQKGYGHDGGGHQQKGHEKGYGGGHQQTGHEKGYGGGHQQKGHEKGYGGGHEKGYGGGHEKGYGGGHEKGYGHTGYGQTGYGQGDSGGQHGGYGSQPQHKGMKYKHSSYEMTMYGDKGGHASGGQHKGHGGYSDSNHDQQGYGYSGPYPNTEYSSSPIVISYEPSSEVGVSADSPSSLDAADTADYIRGLHTADSGEPPYESADPIILDDTVPLSSSDFSSSPGNGGASNEGLKGDLNTGNFDLNLEFNGELPAPFRRTDSIRNSVRTPRKRKKISSTFIASEDQLKSLSSGSTK